MEVTNLQMKYREYEPFLSEILLFLKRKQTKAVADKKPEEAIALQDQIWTLKDYQAGHLKNINKQLLAEAFDIFDKFIKKPAPSQDEEDQKKLRSLKKKRDQIKKLIEKQEKGEKLEANQIEKINSLANIEDEISELER